MDDLNRTQNSYFSRSGYRMWGGDPQNSSDLSASGWVSIGLLLGVALGVASCLAAWL